MTGAVEIEMRVRQQERISLRPLAPRLRPIVEVRQFDAQDRCLQGIEPTVDADLLMMIFGCAAMHAQAAQARGERVVVRGEHPAVARAAEILRRVETETIHQAERPRRAARRPPRRWPAPHLR
jgi:hypothetical protein